MQTNYSGADSFTTRFVPESQVTRATDSSFNDCTPVAINVEHGTQSMVESKTTLG